MRPAESGWNAKDPILGKLGGVAGSCFCFGLPSHRNKPFTLLSVSLHLCWTPSLAQENAIKTTPLKKSCLATIPWQKSVWQNVLIGKFFAYNFCSGWWLSRGQGWPGCSWWWICTINSSSVHIKHMLNGLLHNSELGGGHGKSFVQNRRKSWLFSDGAEDQPLNVLAAFKDVVPFMGSAVCRAVEVSKHLLQLLLFYRCLITPLKPQPPMLWSAGLN